MLFSLFFFFSFSLLLATVGHLIDGAIKYIIRIIEIYANYIIYRCRYIRIDATKIYIYIVIFTFCFWLLEYIYFEGQSLCNGRSRKVRKKFLNSKFPISLIQKEKWFLRKLLITFSVENRRDSAPPVFFTILLLTGACESLGALP